jgi:hypothetical protein
VYLKKGLHTVKKEVVVGQANTNQIIIKSGLQEGDRVLLSLPKTLEDLPFENAS